MLLTYIIDSAIIKNISELTKLFVYRPFVFVTTGTLSGRAADKDGWAIIYADGHDLMSISNTPSTATLPNNTRLLAVVSHQSGFVIKLSNGFVTGTHWKCSTTEHVDWRTLNYNDDAWKPAIILNWLSWDGVHGLEPAELISAEAYSYFHGVHCRGWPSRYYTSD